MFFNTKKKKQKEDMALKKEAMRADTVQSSWRNETVARTLNPSRLATLLQNAVQDYSSEYLTLAEEMEEKDPHYAGVLGVRKRAVSRLGVSVEASDESTSASKHAELIQSVTEKPEFESMVYDLTDALGKGYSAVEILWDFRSGTWLPAQYAWRDPRWFMFDTKTMRTLRIHDPAEPEGREIPAYKFIVHVPRLKNGIPIRGGLARLVAVSYMCKQFVLADWLSFLDLYGMPIRIGKYGPAADEAGISTLKNAVASLGVDGAAVIPESMDITFEQMANAKSSSTAFREAAQWLDEQVSKAVLGQTMTTDDGSSRAQADVHNDVRLDILESDANEIQNTINDQLVKPIIDLNFGIPERYPRVIIRVPRKENIELLVESVVKLLPSGLKVPESFIREKLGIPDAEEDETLLGVGTAPTEIEENTQSVLSLNQTGDEDDPPDEWEAIPQGVVAWVRRLVKNAKSLEDVKAQLNTVPELRSAGVEAFALALVKERMEQS